MRPGFSRSRLERHYLNRKRVNKSWNERVAIGWKERMWIRWQMDKPERSWEKKYSKLSTRLTRCGVCFSVLGDLFKTRFARSEKYRGDPLLFFCNWRNGGERERGEGESLVGMATCFSMLNVCLSAELNLVEWANGAWNQVKGWQDVVKPYTYSFWY